MDEKYVWDAAETVFASNRLPNGVITPELPHFNGSFLWDTAIIARARALTWPHDGAHLIQQHLAGQHPNGMIPNEVIYQPRSLQQNVLLKYHESTTHIYGSTITQPPILSTAVRHVATYMAKDERTAFLKSVFPNLKRYAEWLFAARSDAADSLLQVVHPYETGCDNSPVWDEPMMIAWNSNQLSLMERMYMRIGRPLLNHYRQASVEFDGTDISERSQNDEILQGLLQLRAVHKNHNTASGVLDDSTAAVIKEIGFNALAAYGFEDLVWIENTLGSDNRLYEIPESLYENIQNHRRSIDEYLWDEGSGSYASIDSRTGKQLSIATAGSLTPLLITTNPARCQAIINRITDPEQFWTPMPIPSVSVQESSFLRTRYWRGPSWPFMRLFIFDALMEMGHDTIAQQIAHAVLRNPEITSFSEYNDPINGQALGKKQFSPAAAEAQIYLHLLKAHQV